ncbi:MAG: redox-regulated ATPase YchF [Myxococcota bacterium]
MALSCGIVGLPNVGKSTLFQCLTACPAQAANYPFCTIDPNVGKVAVPDQRLYQLQQVAKSQRVVPTDVTFLDIAGLVRGASKGEGLGNQFLAHIREVSALCHVVRCFEGEITHVDGNVDPLRDVGTIETELILRDIDTITNRLTKTQRTAKSGNAQAQDELQLCQALSEHLNQGLAARTFAPPPETHTWPNLIASLHLLSSKPVLFVANISEDGLQGDGNAHLQALTQFAQQRGDNVVPVCAHIEQELMQLDAQQQQEFLEAYGLQQSGLQRVIAQAFRLLGLMTYFTAGVQEARAWTITQGTKAPQAAGVIHTDFEKGFIKAEVCNWKDLIDHNGEAGCRQAGLLRLEGKDYVVQDGDVIHFKVNA